MFSRGLEHDYIHDIFCIKNSRIGSKNTDLMKDVLPQDLEFNYLIVSSHVYYLKLYNWFTTFFMEYKN